MLNGISERDSVLPNGRKTIQEKVSEKSGREKRDRNYQEGISDGKKSERGGISNMGGEKLAGKGKFPWRDMNFGGKKEWPL